MGRAASMDGSSLEHVIWWPRFPLSPLFSHVRLTCARLKDAAAGDINARLCLSAPLGHSFLSNGKDFWPSFIGIRFGRKLVNNILRLQTGKQHPMRITRDRRRLAPV